VDLSNVRFGWPGTADLLAIERLCLEPGERVMLLGPSGSGKSTLLALLAGIVAPTSGTLRVLGQELSAMPAHRRDAFRGDHIGFVFQQFNLLPYLSMLDNVLLPLVFCPERKRRAGPAPALAAGRLLERLGLDPGDLRRIDRLSVGQQQRIAVARALLGSPELLLADEPTSALDRGNALRHAELLREESTASGTTLVVATHDERIASCFTRVIEMDSLQA